MLIRAIIDSKIRLQGEDLPEDLMVDILDALTIPNLEREQAKKQNQWGWQKMPESIELFETDQDLGHLILPRGFASDLVEGLFEYGHDIVWDDRRQFRTQFKMGQRARHPRPYQQAAMKTLVEMEQGIYKAPAGCVSGDTKIRINRAGKGFETTIEKAYRKFNGLGGRGPMWDNSIPTYCRALVDGVFRQHRVENIVASGIKPTIMIVLESGKKIRCTREHGILSESGWKEAGSLSVGHLVTVNGQEACVRCGRTDRRLIGMASRKNPYTKPAKYPGHCMGCASELSNTREKRTLDKDGYVLVHAPIGHPRAVNRGVKGARNGYVREHILVAEEAFGRLIGREEHVHHCDGDKSNNSPENLVVLTPSEHNVEHRRFLNLEGSTSAKGGANIFIPKLERIVSIEDAGECETYDMMMEDPYNNFVANGIVVHNSGKTATILFMIHNLTCKSIVIVNTKDILWQWQKRCSEFLGPDYPIGQVGDSKVEVSPYLTIATAQTLHSRFDELEASGFFDEFGLMCLDECHHSTADTYSRIVDRFSSRYRVGVSATPDKTGDFALATNVLGPIVHSTSPKELQGLGVLMQPTIIRVNTGFEFSFKSASRGRQSNYGKLIERLVRDPDRNSIIVKAIMRESGHHCLLITKRIEHIDIIESMLQDEGYKYPILRLTGQDKNEHREYVVATAAEEPCLVLSTLADEALDIPRLDRGFLPFPQKNTGLVTQQVGRFEREHPDKHDAIIYDFVDGKIPPLDNQWAGRRFEVYEPRGYEIKRMKVSDLD